MKTNWMVGCLKLAGPLVFLALISACGAQTPPGPLPAGTLPSAATPTPAQEARLEPSSAPTSLPPAPAPAATATGPIASAATNANLRAGPGLRHPIIGSALPGQKLEIVAMTPGGDWYLLASGEWIAASLVDNAPAVPVAAAIPTTPPTASPTRLRPTLTPTGTRPPTKLPPTSTPLGTQPPTKLPPTILPPTSTPAGTPPATKLPPTVPPTGTPPPPAAPTLLPPTIPPATPPPCAVLPGASFNTAWTADKLRGSLGCPTGPEQSLASVYEPFKGGFMLWRGDTREIYAVYNDGTWQVFADQWVDGQPEYSCTDGKTPATTPPTPHRGFGLVWCTGPNVRNRLGAALSDEIGNNRPVQDFQSGVMLLAPERSARPLVLNATNGKWQVAP